MRDLERTPRHDAPELLDEHGYPTDEALDYLRTFTGSAHQLVELLEHAMGAYGAVKVEQVADELDRQIHRVTLVTGGWSGNEDVIAELDRSFFWFAYWQSSHRGGKYSFHVPEGRWDEPMMDWPPAHSTPDKPAAKPDSQPPAPPAPQQLEDDSDDLDDPDGSRRRAAFPPCTTQGGEQCGNCPRNTLDECVADLAAHRSGSETDARP